MIATRLRRVVGVALALFALVGLFTLYSRIVFLTFRSISAGVAFLGGLVLVTITVVVGRRLFW
ncbi:hypothetical protein [Halalkalicoccus jeotgali]|nr:hypothetical protein [Halalkalicoccus jeotgali]